jgi:hypothetical protein
VSTQSRQGAWHGRHLSLSKTGVFKRDSLGAI